MAPIPMHVSRCSSAMAARRTVATTPVLQNTLNPEWDGALELIIPGGTTPSRTKEPLLHIAVIDDDNEEEGRDGDDDPLGEIQLRLTETCGAFFRVPMEGMGVYGGRKQEWESYITFCYELSEYIPAPLGGPPAERRRAFRCPSADFFLQSWWLQTGRALRAARGEWGARRTAHGTPACTPDHQQV